MQYLGVIFQTNFEFHRHIHHSWRMYSICTVMSCRELEYFWTMLVFWFIRRLFYSFSAWFVISSTEKGDGNVLLLAFVWTQVDPEDRFRLTSWGQIYRSIDFERIGMFLGRGHFDIVRVSLEPHLSLRSLLASRHRSAACLSIQNR